MSLVTQSEYDADVLYLQQLCEKIVQAKRSVYTQGSEDILYNFKLNALVCKTTPGQQLATYLLKQLISVIELLTNPAVQDTEGETRFADAQNYINLAHTMWKSQNHHTVTTLSPH